MPEQSSKLFQKMTCIHQALEIVHSLGLDTTVLRQAYSKLSDQLAQESAPAPRKRQGGKMRKPDAERILELLAKNPNGMTRRELQQRIHRTVEELEPVIQELTNAGDIAAVPAGHTVSYFLSEEPSE